MNHKLGFISYTLAAVASLCFVSGIVVLSGGDVTHDEAGRIISYDR